MKQLILLPFIFLLFFPFILFSQSPTKVVLLGQVKSNEDIPDLLPVYPLDLIGRQSPRLPIHKLPEQFYKKYLIRVAQSDKRIFKQFMKDPKVAIYFHRGKDHDGFDYFLPFGHKKEDAALAFLNQLPSAIQEKSIVVKMEPRKITCHCHGKF